MEVPEPPLGAPPVMPTMMMMMMMKNARGENAMVVESVGVAGVHV